MKVDRIHRGAILQPASARRGFTLVELIVASIIGVLIAGATTTTISHMLRLRTDTRSRREAFERADAAASRIARDIQTLVRDADLLQARVQVVDDAGGGNARDLLLLFCRSLRRVRGASEYPEGADFEVQYRLQDGDGGASLWRRADPVPDDVPDGGGVAAPVVAGVVSLNIEATDGESWFDVWDSDYDGYPHGLRITLVARSSRGTTQATARRTVAIDRVPLAPSSDDSTVESTDTGGAAATGGAATGGGGR